MLPLLEYFSYLLILAGPAYLIKIPLPVGGSINGLDLLLIAYLAAWGLYLFKEKPYAELKQFALSLQPVLIATFFFLATAVFSIAKTISEENWQRELGLLKSYFLLPILAALLISFLSSQKKTFLPRLLDTYFFYSSTLSILGIIYILKNYLSYDNRLVIFHGSPNFLAGTLSIGIIIGSYRLFQTIKDTKPISLFTFFSLFFHLLSLYYTQSLGSFLSLFLSIIIYIFYQLFLIKKVFFLPLVTSFLGLLAILFLPFFLNQLSYQPQIPPSSLDSRIAIYQSSIKILRENWLTGIGLGNFQTTYLSYQQFFPPYPQWAVPHSHNFFLHLWVEMGILGMGTMAILFFFSLAALSKKTPIGVLLAIILSYFLFHGTVDMPIWKNDLTLIFWIILWCSYTVKQKPLQFNPIQ